MFFQATSDSIYFVCRSSMVISRRCPAHIPRFTPLLPLDVALPDDEDQKVLDKTMCSIPKSLMCGPFCELLPASASDRRNSRVIRFRRTHFWSSGKYLERRRVDEIKYSSHHWLWHFAHFVRGYLYPPLYLVLTILDKSTWTACIRFFIVIIFIFFCT